MRRTRLIRCLLCWLIAGAIVATAVARGEDVLVIYSAEWCAPCQRLKRDLEKHPEMTEGLVPEFRDPPPLNATIPDIRIERDGVVIARVVGYRGRRELTNWIRSVVR